MPVVKMPNGDQVRFPDEMPKEEIRGLIASKFPEFAASQTPSEQNQVRIDEAFDGSNDARVDTGLIAPFSQLVRGEGDNQTSVPGTKRLDFDQGIIGAIKSGVTLAGDAASGDLAGMTDDQIMRRTLEMAGVGTPLGVASKARLAPQTTRALPETSQSQLTQSAERIGVELPRAVSSDSSITQQAGKVLSNVPIGGQPLRKASQQSLNQLDEAASNVQAGFGAGSVPKAGDAARTSIDDFISGTLTKRVENAYNKVDDLVNPELKRPLSATQKISAQIIAKRTNAGITNQSEAVKRVSDAVTREGGLNYNGVKDLRSYIGEFLENPSAIASGMSQSELKRIYGSLTDDLRATVGMAGGSKASKAFEAANSLASRTANDRKQLNRIMGANSDEAFFDKIVASAGSTSRADVKLLAKVRKATSQEAWNEIGSAAITRLGRDADGNFSPQRFITGWGKISPQGKAILFRGKDTANLAKSLDDIAIVSRRFKELQQFANPSGTGQTVIGAGIGSGLMIDPLTASASVLGSYTISRLLSRPKTAKSIANWSRAYNSAIRNPTRATIKGFHDRSKALSGLVAAETGTPSLAPQIHSGLINVLRGEQKDEINENPQ